MQISEEIARESLAEFLAHYDLDPASLPEDQRKAFEVSEGRILRAVRSGALEFLSDGRIKQILRKPAGEIGEIVYEELSGHAKIAMKNKRVDDHYGRIYALLGSLSGLGEGAILKLKGADLSVAECVGMIFLQV